MSESNKLKILLLGESSGFYTNLKDGLIELGHDVVLASFSDGYKKIRSNDISFDAKLPGLLGKLENRVRPLCALPALSGFDVVQLINPFEFDISGFPARQFLKQVKKRNGKFFLSACGSDAFYYQKASERLRYHPLQEQNSVDATGSFRKFTKENSFQYNTDIARLADGIIPIFYDCEVAYRDFKNMLPTIPLPINASKVDFHSNSVCDRLVIFHGLSRYGFKGTRHVEEAFKILKKRYPNAVELVIEGGLPLHEYLKIQRRANIIVDQVLSYSAGMNALYAMAHGKVVLSGAEPESLASMGISYSPVVNITPDAHDIVCKIERFIGDDAFVQRIGAESREFVVKHHNHVSIAKMYVEAWNSC